MRLIDANALFLEKFVRPPYDWHKGWNDALDAVAEQAPTVDAAPVVHARWIIPDFADLDDEHHYCSACNRCALYYEDIVPEFSEADESIEDVHCLGGRSLGIVEFLTTYCPNCGAKMDDERREHD